MKKYDHLFHEFPYYLMMSDTKDWNKGYGT